ncbi:Fe2+-dependent dioxygenase [Caulobacter sp. 17J80-11]|uniref:Fe2+-dependent dioxygenase n=1 Tax=Caulobacter sp. 17J80-11 TaxID=2763502 RepID=UPI001653AF2E|nr:Fe2+-dependent dioxygenase [Caulobacter sp. 17J80-11]MBC6983213.1 Fe2+-dependent dioxygenase [Caulobacter sp. 17J80-11]
MLILSDVLSREDVLRVREGLAEAPFQDGRLTAGPTARKVKSNTQADRNHASVQALTTFVRQALERHGLFTAYARPARWSRLLFSRYEPGQQYGLHTDDAVMGSDAGERMRSDMSFTLFLSDPDTYEGGALLLSGLDGEREVRPPAGSAVLYPTGQLHRVTPVTCGERLAAVGWIQSRVGRADQREILFDLHRVRATLPDDEGRLLLDKALGNLLRLWWEP